MPDQPIKKNTAFTFFIPGLVSQANTKTFQSNPTIASGDFQISKDGGAFANIGTLPDVEPNSTTQVRVILTADEMNADQINVRWIDASGAEWCDGSLMIFTASAQMADLATASALSTLSGYVDTEVAAIKAKTDNLPSDPADESNILAAIADIGSGSGISTAQMNILLTAIADLIPSMSNANAAIDINITRYADYTKTISDLSISSDWTEMWLTIKRDELEADASAQLQYKVSNPAVALTDGLQVVNGAAAGANRTKGALSVDQPNGTVTLTLEDDVSALLGDTKKGNWYYDVKQVTASGKTIIKRNRVAIATAITRT